MPVTTISIKKGRPQEFLKEMMEVVIRCEQEVLKISEADRNIRVHEYDPDLFESKDPYEIFIEITLFSGRSKETKARLFQEIVQRLEEKLKVEASHVMILLNEIPTENWGIRGGKQASEIELGFRINV